MTTSVGNASAQTLTVGKIAINLDIFQVTVARDDIQVPGQEYDLLLLLMQQPDKIIPFDQLSLAMWRAAGKAYTRRLRVLVHHLRRKLTNAWPYELRAVRGRGYGLVLNRNAARGDAEVPDS